MNIPIYRAKKIDSDEWVEGYYCTGYKREHLIRTGGVYDSVQHFEIDQTTLAIHFPNIDGWYSIEQVETLIKIEEDYMGYKG